MRRLLSLLLLASTLLAADSILFQVSTLDALSLGIFQGAMSFGELKHHGDFGLGTFDSLTVAFARRHPLIVRA